ncbi:hypothetical protein VE03_09165 [Pseudogymnoascus sp. 23342-1-I1]|nr:hypothetical protein VE03_09165 [Pseudogymnoascus sp. 23342-1-I1]
MVDVSSRSQTAIPSDEGSVKVPSTSQEPNTTVGIDPPHVDVEKSFRWLKLTDLRHASPAEVVIMGNQNTLLQIMQTVLRSQENVVLAVNKNYGAPQKRRAPVAKKRVYKRTKRVSEATTAAESEEREEGSSAMDMDEDVSDDNGSEQSRDASGVALEKLLSLYAEESFASFQRYIDGSNGHLYVTRSKGAERSAEVFVEGFLKEERDGDVLVDHTDEPTCLYWLSRLDEVERVMLFISLSKKLKLERSNGRLL